MSSSFWDKANKIYNAVENFTEKRVADMQVEHEKKQVYYRNQLKMKSNDELKQMMEKVDNSSILKSMICEEMQRRKM